MQAKKNGFTLFQPALMTVFMVEMWERFAFYGGRAVLVLFLISPEGNSGLGISDASATAIYGLYTATALLLGLFGGWISDAYIGAQRSVSMGAWLIIIGNGLLALGAFQSDAMIVYLGLAFDALGVAFLKPNASALVAQLFPAGGSGRDAGFLIFYMGISIGALFGSLSIPLLAAKYGWWAGFASTSCGMLCGLLQFYLRRHHLKNIGIQPNSSKVFKIKTKACFYVATPLLVTFFIVMQMNLALPLIVEFISWLMVVVTVIYFFYLFSRPDLDTQARKRMVALMLLCIGLSLYLIGYHQGGSSLSIFAERFTDRTVWGWEIPAGVFQSIIPFVSILISPIFAFVWIRLEARKMVPSSIVKFGIALILMGVGFLLMSTASSLAADHGTVLPTWLLCTFLIHTFADLCIAPIGLSATSKLAPPNRLAQTMGLWFVAGAIGNALSGVLAGKLNMTDATLLSGGFFNIFLLGLISGIIMFALAPLYKKLSGVHA